MIPKRVLICGLGSIGQRYCHLINSEWPEIKIAALRSKTNSKRAPKKDSHITFSSYENALNWKPETVIIASPASIHQKQALIFARENIPVLIEKPIGTGKEELKYWEELLMLSEKVQINVGYVLRHDKCAKYIAQQIEINTTGEIVSTDFYCGSWLPDWRKSKDYRTDVSSQKKLGGGVLLEMSHEIDMAQWLFGNLEVNTAKIRNSGQLEIDVEDQAIIVGQSEKSPFTTIRLDFCTAPTKRQLVIRGSKAEINWNLIEGTTIISKTDGTQEIFNARQNPDDRFLSQLKIFWDKKHRQDTRLCTVAEGLNILQKIDKIRKLSKAIGEG